MFVIGCYCYGLQGLLIAKEVVDTRYIGFIVGVYRVGCCVLWY